MSADEFHEHPAKCILRTSRIPCKNLHCPSQEYCVSLFVTALTIRAACAANG
jgi:hypothetical protein